MNFASNLVSVLEIGGILLRSKWAAGKEEGNLNRYVTPTSNAAASPFSSQAFGPGRKPLSISISGFAWIRTMTK